MLLRALQIDMPIGWAFSREPTTCIRIVCIRVCVAASRYSHTLRSVIRSKVNFMCVWGYANVEEEKTCVLCLATDR